MARHGNENGSCQGRPGHAETLGLRCRVGRGEIVAVAQGSPLSGINSTRGWQAGALQPKWRVVPSAVQVAVPAALIR